MMGWSVPGPIFQSLNAGFIFIFAPLMAWLWIWLARRQLNPSTPVKFALGVAMAGLGFPSVGRGYERHWHSRAYTGDLYLPDLLDSYHGGAVGIAGGTVGSY